MNKRLKGTIYKSCNRPVLTILYRDNKRTKNIFRTTEMKIFRNILRYTLRKKNTDMWGRRYCQVGTKRRRA